MAFTKYFAVFLFSVCIGLSALGQTLRVGAGYSLTNARYDRLTSAEATLLFSLNERWSIGPQIGYGYWHYREEYILHIGQAAGIPLQMRDDRHVPFLGASTEYKVIARERFSLSTGLSLHFAMFTEHNPDMVSSGSPTARFARVGAQIPLIAVFRPDPEKRLGIFGRFAVGHMIASERHKNPFLNGGIEMLGLQFGLQWDLGM